jgi:hypothetical protein
LDVLFPLFTDEPAIYLPPPNTADQADKCLPVTFNHRSDDVLPSWERPSYHHGMIQHHHHHYDDLQGQGLFSLSLSLQVTNNLRL